MTEMTEMTEMTRDELGGFLDLKLLKEIYAKPPEPMHIPGVGILRPEAAWKKLVVEILIPMQGAILKTLRRYRHLLTEEEQGIVEEFSEAVSEYERTWRNRTFSYPHLPRGFENILQD